jgi:group I intron endonuclease
MNWLYQEQEFSVPNPNPYEGFVYVIENMINKKLYVGKKHFWTRQKNRKTGRREKKESDWQLYYGSSEELKSDIEKYGLENFKRTILHLCIYKKQMTFLEQKEQWDRNVLLNDNYYNTNIGGKFFVRERKIYWATHKEITTKNNKWREIKSESMKGEKNIAKKPEVRAKISEKKKGEKHHQYGKPISPEHNKKLHEAALKSVIQEWQVTTPNGESFIIKNMNDFCRKNNLSMGAMSMVSSGKRKHHKKYICKKI